MRCFQWSACLLALACGGEEAIPTDYADPTHAITPDEVTELGVSFAELDGGELYVLGDPVRVMEGKFTLRMSTSDGALQEEVECLLRATALDAWICEGQVSAMAGSFALTKHPGGDVRYSIWMSERYGHLMGGVSVTPTSTSVEVLPGGALRGSLTSFSAGVWLEDYPACAPGPIVDASQN